MAKIKRVTTNVSEDTEKLDHTYIASDSEKWYSHSGKWLNIKLNIKLSYNLAMTLLGIYPKEMKVLCSHKNLYSNVYVCDSFICSGLNLEATQTCFNGWMVHPRHGILVTHIKKKKNIETQNNPGQSLRNVMSKQKQFQKLPYSMILFT